MKDQGQKTAEEWTSSKRRRPLTLLLGVVLTAYAGIMLLSGLLWILGRGFVDFPCDVGYGPDLNVANETRIAYCISLRPRDAISGGTVYAHGTSAENTLTLPPRVSWYGSLTFEREGERLAVNDQVLSPGETYTQFRWFPSFNPWAVLTARAEVTNQGITGGWPSISAQVVYVSGDVYEGLLPSPVGPILLGMGLWLIVRGAGGLPMHVARRSKN